MQLGRKKTLMDRAQDVVDQVAETVTDTVIPQLEAALEQTREKAGPALADARDRALPVIAEGRAVAAEKAAVGASLAAEKAAVARDLAVAKVNEARGIEPEPKGGKLKKLLLVGGLLAIGGVVFAKLRGQKQDANWQSSYVPTPPPATPSTPSSSTTSSTTAATPAATDDIGGGEPGEAISDAVEEPHGPTTPDAPAEVIDIDDVPGDRK